MNRPCTNNQEYYAMASTKMNSKSLEKIDVASIKNKQFLGGVGDSLTCVTPRLSFLSETDQLLENIISDSVTPFGERNLLHSKGLSPLPDFPPSSIIPEKFQTPNITQLSDSQSQSSKKSLSSSRNSKDSTGNGQNSESSSGSKKSVSSDSSGMKSAGNADDQKGGKRPDGPGKNKENSDDGDDQSTVMESSDMDSWIEYLKELGEILAAALRAVMGPTLDEVIIDTAHYTNIIVEMIKDKTTCDEATSENDTSGMKSQRSSIFSASKMKNLYNRISGDSSAFSRKSKQSVKSDEASHEDVEKSVKQENYDGESEEKPVQSEDAIKDEISN